MWLSLFRLMIYCATLIVSQAQAQDKWLEPPAAIHPNSRWTAVSWDDLPRIFDDNLREALPAWLSSCSRPQAAWRKACSELLNLKNADGEVIRIWMMAHLQPYQVESLAANGNSASTSGLLTGYYEPVLKAKRTPDAQFRHPVYRLPIHFKFTREEIDTKPEAQTALHGRVIAYLDDAMDALAVQIQGSGQLELLGINDSRTRIRLAFAGSNDQPYKSVGAWLRQQHGVRDLSWPAIKAWVKSHPEHLNPLLWSNPRVVFFKEHPASNESQTSDGPVGAQGLPLTAGRSIAVDPKSIPYGTPVWLASSGESLQLNRLVLAQDTGSAIVGAVRADYYVGSGDAAGEIAGRLKQNLQMWALWPK